ncbi:MAG: RNA polymerase subunit sigma-70, partial [Bacteroidota bacterium]
KRKNREDRFPSFQQYGEQLDAVLNPDLTIEEEIEYRELSKEMQVRCMSGMLMCLNREQRLIYILGDTFGINHNLGSEIFEVSPQNFRIKLHRARKELYNYMNNKCGLINKNNPCRCPKKAKALKKMGMLNEQNMEFNIATRTRIMDYVETEYENLKLSIEDKYTELYRNHPAKDDFEKETIIDEILEDELIMKHLNMN